jgi:hypothetical protein
MINPIILGNFIALFQARMSSGAAPDDERTARDHAGLTTRHGQGERRRQLGNQSGLLFPLFRLLCEQALEVGDGLSWWRRSQS